MKKTDLGTQVPGNGTFYNSVQNTNGADVPISEVLQQIKSGEWKQLVEEFRAIRDNNKRRKYKTDNVPAITISGTFPDRRKANDIGQHSGLIAIDLDHVDDIGQAIEQLRNDEYTHALFKSISGEGLCCIVKIPPAKHSKVFPALERYYLAKHSLAIDPACKDVSRCRFISYDPDLYLNPDSKTFTQTIKNRPGRPEKIRPVFVSDHDIEHVLSQIDAQQIDITADYDTWVQIAFAIYSKYGPEGEEYFQRVSRYHPEYDERKTSLKYRSAAGGSGVTIATFFHHAKKHGLEITPESKHIQRIATYTRKRQGGTRENAIQQLRKVDQIEPERSWEIVDQVFNAPGIPPIDDTREVVDQLEHFMRSEYDLQYNEITLKYEHAATGIPLTDRDINSIYLNAKKQVPKATKDLVFSLIDSDRTKSINPLKDFFTDNIAVKRNGLIKRLAETIQGPNSPEYVETFLTKWIVGAVAMWHGQHSPLMFVLVGSKQNTGKTYWLRNLLPDDLRAYYAEAELTGDKDENLLMCSKAFIMNDEMSNKSRRDITVMKQLCSKEYFTLRKPYGKTSEDHKRIATLAGTSNTLEILSDPTGNRRIIPVEVTALDHDKYNGINRLGLWMEAYHLFKSGYRYELTSADIDHLNENTVQFTEPSAEAELLDKYFRPVTNSYDPREQLTNTEIKSELERLSDQKLSARKLGAELRNLGYEQKAIKIEKRTRKIYEVIKINRKP